MQNGLLIGLLLLGAHASASQVSDAQDAYERGDFVKAIEILGPMAEAGDVDALGNLGNMYAFGQGVPQDFTKAAELWSKAAEKGLGTAMGNMAKLYSLGLGGLPKDPQIATDWLKKAAEHRHVPSMIQLSVLYQQGDTVEKSLVEALAWAGLAASNTQNPNLRAAAIQQVKSLAKEATPEQMSAAQQRSYELAKVIDLNVKKYKTGGT